MIKHVLYQILINYWLHWHTISLLMRVVSLKLMKYDKWYIFTYI